MRDIHEEDKIREQRLIETISQRERHYVLLYNWREKIDQAITDESTPIGQILSPIKTAEEALTDVRSQVEDIVDNIHDLPHVIQNAITTGMDEIDIQQYIEDIMDEIKDLELDFELPEELEIQLDEMHSVLSNLYSTLVEMPQDAIDTLKRNLVSSDTEDALMLRDDIQLEDKGIAEITAQAVAMEMGAELNKLVGLSELQAENLLDALLYDESSPLHTLQLALVGDEHHHGLYKIIRDMYLEVEDLKGAMKSVPSDIGDIFQIENGKIVGVDLGEMAESIPIIQAYMSKLNERIEKGISVENLPDLEEWRQLGELIFRISGQTQNINRHLYDLGTITDRRTQEIQETFDQVYSSIIDIEQTMPDGATINEIKDYLVPISQKIDEADILDAQAMADITKYLESFEDHISHLQHIPDLEAFFEDMDIFIQGASAYFDRSDQFQSNLIEIMDDIHTSIDSLTDLPDLNPIRRLFEWLGWT